MFDEEDEVTDVRRVPSLQEQQARAALALADATLEELAQTARIVRARMVGRMKGGDRG